MAASPTSLGRPSSYKNRSSGSVALPEVTLFIHHVNKRSEPSSLSCGETPKRQPTGVATVRSLHSQWLASCTDLHCVGGHAQHVATVSANDQHPRRLHVQALPAEIGSRGGTRPMRKMDGDVRTMAKRHTLAFFRSYMTREGWWTRRRGLTSSPR